MPKKKRNLTKTIAEVIGVAVAAAGVGLAAKTVVDKNKKVKKTKKRKK